jgi:hypothetical protein
MQKYSRYRTANRTLSLLAFRKNTMSLANTIIMPCEYFPCVAWFSHWLQHEGESQIDINEYFVRASMRNRCYVAGANQIIALSIPLAGGRNQKTVMKDVKISNETPWQALHWKTIVSCYQRSPFFEYYQSDLELFFQQKHSFLIDWNLESVKLINKLLGIQKEIVLSQHYLDKANAKLDMRESWRASNYFEFVPGIKYWQTFEDRNGFQPNLCILDLLCCEGNSVLNILAP